MLVFDFEVFKYDWLVCITDISNKKEYTIINDRAELYKFYTHHKNDLWCGYNVNRYDKIILNAILTGLNPYNVSQWIINKNKIYDYPETIKDFEIITYDFIMRQYKLKQLEGFMGHDIRETTVPFDIDRKLTEEEIAETVYYCRHDVSETAQVMLRRHNELKTQLALCKEFNLNAKYLSKTQAVLASIILNAKPRTLNDEWDIKLPDTLIVNKYREVIDWFLNIKNHTETAKLKVKIANVPHIFGWGGLHGSIDKYHFNTDNEHTLLMLDVTQLYPSLMLEYNIYSRAIENGEKLREILQTSIRLKNEGKTEEREPYKRICNIIYGAMGDKGNKLYDPRNRNLVCVFGQLLILDLIEKLEPYCELIQSNTDGILIKVEKSKRNIIDKCVSDWEKRTRLSMTCSEFKTIHQKDVNNYVAVTIKGKTKCKGVSVKFNTELDNDWSIVNEAVREYLINSKDFKQTINECNDLIRFQKIYKLEGKYTHAKLNGQIQSGSVFRVFASKNMKNGTLYKCYSDREEKFNDCPEHCEIINTDILGLTAENIDKEFYIQLAEKRLFGKLGKNGNRTDSGYY